MTASPAARSAAKLSLAAEPVVVHAGAVRHSGVNAGIAAVIRAAAGSHEANIPVRITRKSWSLPVWPPRLLPGRLLAVRVAVVQRRHDLVVVAAGLAVAEELHSLDLDLGGVRLGFEQRHDLGDELIQGHRDLVVLLPGEQPGAHRR